MKTYQALAIYTPLLDAADRGAFSLPDDLAGMRAGLVALAAARDGLTEPPAVADVRQSLVRDTVAAAVAGKALPEPTSALKAAPTREAYMERLRTIAAAESELAIDVANAIGQHGDRLITDHLRPALADLLDELRPAAEVFAPHAHLSDVDLLDAPDDVRAAVSVIDRSAKRYAQLREAQRVTPTAVGYDTEGVLADVGNYPLLWGDVATYRAMSKIRADITPWPTGRRAYMTWLVTATEPTPEVWMPTGPERDSRWLDLFGDELKRHRAAVRRRDDFQREGVRVISESRRNMTGAQKLAAALTGPSGDEAA